MPPSPFLLRLSAVVPTRNGARRLPNLLPSLVELCDEVIVLVDSETTDDSAEVARRFTDRVFTFEHDDAYRNMQLAMFDRVRGDWFLWVDDDETLSPQWTRPIVDELMSMRDATFIMTPTRWIVPPGEHAIVTGTWYPNMLPRLFRNIRSIAKFGTTPHEILWMAGAGVQVPDLHVYHWNFVVKDRAERERIAAFYVSMDPANACVDTYLYEDYRHEIAAFDDRPVDRIVQPLSGRPSSNPYAIVIRVVDGPQRLRPGMRYTYLVDIANCSSRALTAPSRSLSATPFAIAAHVLRAGDGDERAHAFGVNQTPMPATLAPMTARRFMINVDAPSEPGRYRIVPDILERDVAWFTQAADAAWSAPHDIEVVAEVRSGEVTVEGGSGLLRDAERQVG